MGVLRTFCGLGPGPPRSTGRWGSRLPPIDLFDGFVVRVREEELRADLVMLPLVLTAEFVGFVRLDAESLSKLGECPHSLKARRSLIVYFCCRHGTMLTV